MKIIIPESEMSSILSKLFRDSMLFLDTIKQPHGANSILFTKPYFIRYNPSWFQTRVISYYSRYRHYLPVVI